MSLLRFSLSCSLHTNYKAILCLGSLLQTDNTISIIIRIAFTIKWHPHFIALFSPHRRNPDSLSTTFLGFPYMNKKRSGAKGRFVSTVTPTAKNGNLRAYGGVMKKQAISKGLLLLTKPLLRLLHATLLQTNFSANLRTFYFSNKTPSTQKGVPSLLGHPCQLLIFDLFLFDKHFAFAFNVRIFCVGRFLSKLFHRNNHCWLHIDINT